MSDIDEPIRWGILGTAGIAESAFLPALREAGEAWPCAVGSRDRRRGRAWAAEHGVARGVEGYDAVVDDPEIEAIYIPLPNGLHAEWTIAALEAGKAVFCEKPLCGTPRRPSACSPPRRATGARCGRRSCSRSTSRWTGCARCIADGAIGEVREIQSRFHFVLDDPDNIRLFAEPGGRLDPGRRLLPDPARAPAVRCRARPRPGDRRCRVDRATGSTPSCGGRSCSPAIAGWCSRAGSAADRTSSRASSAPRARSA